MTRHLRCTALLGLTALAACGSVKVAPVTIQPIHMVIDVNLHSDATTPTEARGSK